MKKVYLAPQTEAIEILGTNAIMASSGYIPEGEGVGGKHGS